MVAPFETRLSLVGLAVLAAAPASAQGARPGGDARGRPDPGFVHEVWTIRDGLPVNSINSLLQSRDGYLWAATFDGLVRFDGVRFTVYNTGNAEGLPSNRIVDLLEGLDGSLWMVTEQHHLVRFRDGTFIHFGPEHGVPDGTLVIHKSVDGTVWVGTESGLGFLRGDRLVPAAVDQITGPVVAIADGAGGILWIGGVVGPVYRYAHDTVTAVVRRSDGLEGGLGTVYEDPSGTLWIGTNLGAYRLAAGGVELVLSAAISEFYASADGSLWMHTASGVFRLQDGLVVRASRKGQSVSRRSMFQADDEGRIWYVAGTDVYRHGQLVYTLAPPSVANPVPAAEARSLLRDHEGSVWIGTNADGLHRLTPSLFTVYSRPEDLGHQNVYPVLQSRTTDAMWFGTWGGGLSRMVDEAVTPVPLGASFVLSLMEDDAGLLWVGTYSAGVRLCNPRTLRCAPHPWEPLRFGYIWAMYQAGGSTWLGTTRGLIRSGPGGWKVLGESDGAPGAPVRMFLETRDGALWMATNGEGLARYRDGEFLRIRAADGAPSDLIRSLYQDADGWLWIGTEDQGLARVDPTAWPAAADRAAGITRVRPRHGLFDEVIHRILEDDFGRMWMSTNRGIFWVRRAELNAFVEGRTSRIHSTGYTERQGLRNREANGGFQPAGIKGRDGRLWFPTQDGAVVVDPAHLHGNLVPPPVVVERVVVGDETYRAHADTITFEVGRRDVEIDYTALSFVAPENVRFRYRLDGYNDTWVEAGNRRTAFYTNIPPGVYAFRVTASTEEGAWNEEGAVVALSVPPYFHETTSYYLLLVGALGLVTLAAFGWRARVHRHREAHLSQLVRARTDQVRHHEAQLEAQNAQLERQAARLAELDRAKSRFFANVSHEFRTPLTLTIGPLEDVRGGLYGSLSEASGRQVGMALRNARRLLRLVNQIMNVAKLDSGTMKLHARLEDLAEFARDIAATFTPVAERQGIRFEVNVPAVRIPLWFDGDAMETVLTNLLSNAFKFTPEGGVVSLSLEAEPGDSDVGEVRLRVADSGRGISPGDLAHVFDRFYQVDEAESDWQPGTGIGLSLARDLVYLHKGDIHVESEIGAGTTFTVTLPRGRRHLREDQIADATAPPRGHAGRTAPRDEPPMEPAAGVRPDEGEPAPEGDPDDIQTVLVVDDNADVREFIRAHLARRYRVIEATDGVEGVSLAERLIPDLVISDVMMPGLDGYGLCRSLRGNPDTDFLPVILLTAKADTEHKVVGLSEGADDYVVKPFEMDELEARVANLIASRRRLRERFGGTRLELHARATGVTSADDAYLDRVRAIIEDHLADESFGVAHLAQAVGQDRSHLYRRLRTLLDETPTDLIRRFRLERASHLLAGKAGTVAEVGYAVGFNSVSYFCKCFRDAYGVTPSTFRDSPHG